jgi:tetratricopeptide (TPR) repeat protein
LWNVPYRRNQYFTGRDEMLQQLHQALTAGSAVELTHPQGVSGLGGIGKTQTALEYAYRYAREYEAVLWVRADSATSLNASFGELARLLQLPERYERDQKRVIEAVLHWLRLHRGWLVIFDNMDDLPLAEPYLPKAGPGHIICTTRARALGNLAHRLELRQMEPETGALFLLRRADILALQAVLSRATSQERDLACTISRELDGLPLALDQAGAYVKETPCTLATYLQLYQQRRHDLLRERGQSGQDYPASVASTWSLSFERVARANPASTELLTLCAFLAPDAIPDDIFTLGAPYPGQGRKPLADQHTFNQACREALRYSLISREADAGTLTMHRLVQSILYENTPLSTRRAWKQRAVLAVHAAGPNPGQIEQWTACDVWIPHVLVCADWIKQERFSGHENIDLLNRGGYYLNERARFSEGAPLYEMSLTIAEQQFGASHIYVVQALNNLASLYQREGKYRESEPLLKRAMSVMEQIIHSGQPALVMSLDEARRIYGPQARSGDSFPHLPQASRMDVPQFLGIIADNLASVYESQGRYEESEALLLHAQELFGRQPERIDPEKAQNIYNQAIIHAHKGNYARAEHLMKQALAIRQRDLGNEHPHTAESLSNLGEIYTIEGRFAEAEPLIRQALSIYERVLGAKHPDTASCLDKLTRLYYARGNYQAAESQARKAVAIWEQYTHPDSAQSFSLLGILCKDQGNYQEAEALFTRALTICERLGPENINQATVLSNLALLYGDQQRYQEAEQLFRQALAIREKQLGDLHPDTQKSRHDLEVNSHNREFFAQQKSHAGQRHGGDEQAAPSPASVGEIRAQAVRYESQQRYDEAGAFYRRALSHQERALGVHHPSVIDSLNDLARFYRVQKNYRAAEPILKRVLTSSETRRGAEDVETAASLNNLARLYFAQGRHREAEPLMKRALAIYEQRLGSHDARTETARSNYQALLRAIGQT